MRKIIDFHKQLASFINDMKGYQFFLLFFIAMVLRGHIIKTDSFWLEILSNLLIAYLVVASIFIVRKIIKKPPKK